SVCSRARAAWPPAGPPPPIRPPARGGPPRGPRPPPAARRSPSPRPEGGLPRFGRRFPAVLLGQDLPQESDVSFGRRQIGPCEAVRGAYLQIHDQGEIFPHPRIDARLVGSPQPSRLLPPEVIGYGLGE